MSLCLPWPESLLQTVSVNLGQFEHPKYKQAFNLVLTGTGTHVHSSCSMPYGEICLTVCVCVCVCVCVYIQYICVDLCVGATVHIRGSYPRYPESQGHIWSKDSEQKEFTSLCRHETPRVLVWTVFYELTANIIHHHQIVKQVWNSPHSENHLDVEIPLRCVT